MKEGELYINDQATGIKAASKVEVKDGELYINDQATGIKAAEEAEIETGLVKAQGGTWWVLGEDGNYTDTEIPVSGVAVTGDEKAGWTLTITDKDGNKQEVKIPSAISSITDLIVVTDHKNLTYSEFEYKGEKEIAKWKGPRTLPADKDKTVYIVTSTMDPVIQINPTTLDLEGANITFSLIDSKNNTPANVNLTAKAYTELLTKAANANGLYSLSMDEVFISDKKIVDFEDQFKNKEKKEILYAVTAGGTVRSEYEVTVAKGSTVQLETLTITDNDDEVVAINGTVSSNKMTVGNTYPTTSGAADNVAGKINVNEWYTVNAEDAAALYDMHLSVSDDDKTLFGIEINEVAGKYQFRVTKTPDNITKAGFLLNIETVANDGPYNTTQVWLGETSAISSEYAYDAIIHEIRADDNKNYFQIPLNLMKQNLGTEGTALWNTKAKKHTVTFLDADDNPVGETSIGLMFVSEVKDVDKASKVSSYKDATNIMFAIKNSEASKYFEIGKQYTAVITFTDGTEDLNTITVPFTLTLPDINTLYVIDPGFIKEGVASCYLYEEDAHAVGAQYTNATFKLNRIFSKSDTSGNFQVTLDDKAEVVNKKASNKLAQMSKKRTAENALEENFDSDAYITLIGDLGKEEGYNQVLSLTISGKYAGCWSYPEDEVFNFQIRIMSPIEQGKIVPAEGTVVSIPASELDGYHFSNDAITGYTYNNQVSYDVLPVWINGASGYSRNDISEVAATSGNKLYFEVESLQPATAPQGNIPAKDGYFLLKGYNVDHTVQTTIKIEVTDIWKRVLNAEVPVEITVE